MEGETRLYLCGPFRVSASGSETLRLRTRKTESLLAYMALRRESWIARDDLIDLFWAGEEASEAKPKLRLALHSIRGVIGQQLESRGDVVRVSRIWVDALDDAPRELVSARILLGRYEDWTTPFQMELERRVEAACLDSVRTSEAPEDQIAALMALVRTEPLNPDYYLALHRALVNAGSLAAARSAARSAIGTLGSECPPSLRQAIGTSFGPAPDLVLAQLAMDLLGQDEPVVRSLVGPAGIGKTYTARQLMRAAREEEIDSVFISRSMAG